MTVTRPRPLGASEAVASRPNLALVLVSLLYGAAQMILISPRMGIGWDESVYASQLAAHAPPAVFSAPRAQGVPLLVAPVVAVTDSVFVLRLYLTAMSTLCLYGAFHVWVRIRGDYVPAVAALLFGGCWLSLFYGNEAMPNLYVALAAVAATGLVVLAARSRWALAGLAGAFAVMSLMRPSDSLVAAVPLAVAVPFVSGRRRLGAWAAIVAGLAVGWGQWAIEAEQRFGGFLTRLRDAGEHNATGWTFTVVEHARALDGPSLCRFGADCGPVSPVALIWWLAIPLMAALGLWAASREGHGLPVTLAAVTGLTMALPYFFYVDYAAPRFLMPAYALLALPIGQAAVTGLRMRGAFAVAVVVGLVAHLAMQGAYAGRLAAINRQGRAVMTKAAADLRELGVRAPCMVYGESGVQIGYLLGCESHGVMQRFGERMPVRIRQAMERGDRLVVVVKKLPPPPYARSWPVHDLAGRWKAYMPPGS
ncbi:hypothetical protein [Thermoactinospora rubra]|uniref:hypothetical protein n=1 Tax=Thermoactinospora rubra TaxID=1088767 RepID=UPI000A0F665B|nr:hypothetical protein [Thermoactinospora rubra]